MPAALAPPMIDDATHALRLSGQLRLLPLLTTALDGNPATH